MVFEELGLVDTHCHVDLFKNPQQIIEEASAHFVHTVAVTNTPSVYFYTEAVAKESPYVWPAVGLHPELAVERKRELSQMWQLLKQTRFVGEIGLDYGNSDLLERKTQLKVFKEILAHCAEYGDKILTVHSRRATEDVVSVIGPNYPGKVILHWYSGTVRDLTRAVEYGFYFSVNSTMVASEKGRRLMAKMPQERILTETDGPFIQLRGAPATPSCVVQIIKNLCDLWHISLEEAQRQVMSNFRQLLAESDDRA